MKPAEIIHHGGADGVTGSCHQWFDSNGHSLMVDCGLFQGQDAEQFGDQQPMLQALRFPVDSLHNLQALVLTHVHTDHVGRLPWLLAAGFQGPIYCSEASARLLPAVLEESLSMGFTRKRRLISRVLAQVQRQLRPLPWRRWETLWPGVRLKLYPAGHILGSAYLIAERQDGHRTLFSGDLGAPWSPLLSAPRPPWRCDQLILESTYGNRRHQNRRERRKTLEAALQRALADRGTVLIPAFSLGRTQELLYELETIIHQQSGSDGSLGDIEVILDSPLASRFTALYREMKPFWDKEAHRRLASGRKPLAFDNLLTINEHEDHLNTVSYLAQSGRPAIVIAASGMCAGGRITNYLKVMLPHRQHNVLFVGYQARGTPGHSIQKYGPGGGWVELDGKRIDIRAGIDTISGYSAHADQQDLLNFIKRMRHKPGHIRLVHGEEAAQQVLAGKIRENWPQLRVEY